MSELLKALSQNTGRRYTCGYAEWLNTLTAEEQQAVRDAMADKHRSNLGLTKLFVDHGLKASADSIMRHRRGLCKTCGPENSTETD